MAKTERIIALDAFRGITIAAMIMVNQPGSWSYKYDQMCHAAWDGSTLTDLIFPFFLVIVGVAMWYAFQKHDQKLSAPVAKKIVHRTVVILLIGLGLNLVKQLIGTGGIDFSSLRLSGVLQRIALCYGVAAILCLVLKPKQLFYTSIGILLAYWMVLWGFGGESPYIAENVIVGKIDQFLLGSSHLRQGYLVDASGLFGSIPAVVNVIGGYLLGRLIAQKKEKKELILTMFLWGIPAVLLARVWDYSFPINKTLWSSSYVLYTTGWALIVLAFLIWIIDIRQKKKWITPFNVFGVNPLFAYVFAEVFGVIMSKVKMVPVDGNMVPLRSWLFEDVCAPIAGNLNGSLLYSVLMMVFYWAILWLLYKRNIYIKI